MLLALSPPPYFLSPDMLSDPSSLTTPSSPKPAVDLKRNPRKVPSSTLTRPEQAEVDFPRLVKSTVKPSVARKATGPLLDLYTLTHVSTS
jgi:hypothetical protein